MTASVVVLGALAVLLPDPAGNLVSVLLVVLGLAGLVAGPPRSWRGP